MDSSGGEMEAARREKRMEERNRRVVVREERMAKVEKEKRASLRMELYAKAVEEIEKTLKGRGEPWEQFRDQWMKVWGKGGHFGKFEDISK
jgi:Flp pilus assembly protein TadB